MNESEASAPAHRPPTYWLVGLRLDPNAAGADFYTLLRERPDYWPITSQGQIIFFQRIESAQLALDLHLHEMGLPACDVPQQITLTLDFAQAFYLLSKESRDETACLLNIINTLLDMLKATAVELPVMYRTDLSLLADHLTFNKEFASFLASDGVDRTGLVEAVQWALGAVMTKAMFVPK